MLDDPAVSRKQAIIKLVENKYVLTDLGSKTTLLNGESVITEVLKNNDNIEIGPYRLHCMIEVFESLLQHLSSQIDQATGDTDPSFSTHNSHHYIERSTEETTDEEREELFIQRVNTIAFYVGIIVVILLFIAGILYFVLELK